MLEASSTAAASHEGVRRYSYDNALAETLNGLYKAQLIHRRAPWKTLEALELAKLEWMAWFNHHRLLEPIGYLRRPRPRPTTIANSPSSP